jgi:hypothetical protein
MKEKRQRWYSEDHKYYQKTIRKALGGMDYSVYDLFINDSNIFDDDYKSFENIENEVSLLITDDLDKDVLRLLRWDVQLFMCCEIPVERREPDQGFLYPKLVYVNGTKIPDIDAFEQERFDFYRHRFDIVNSQVVKIRYANYFFQYGEKNVKYVYGIELCNLLYNLIPSLNLGHECVVSVSRLFEVALSFSITDMIQKLDGVIGDVFSKENGPVTYLELLSISRIVVDIIHNNKKIPFSDGTKELIISSIKKMMDYYKQSKEYQIYRNCCANYIEWLKVLGRNDEVAEMLVAIGDSYIMQADEPMNSYLVKAEFFEQAARHFVDIGEREKVYYLKVKIKNALKDASNAGEFKTVSSTHSMPIEQLQRETADFFGNNIDETFDRFSHSSDFIIDKSKPESKAEEDSKNPIFKIVGFNHIHGNRKTFNSNDDEDVKKHFFYFYYGIELETTFTIMVKYIWDKMIADGLTPDMPIGRVCNTEYMDDRQKEIISRGIYRFFENDYISALHILVPQFESYFRTFFEWGGFPTTTLQNDSTQHEQTFNEFLRQPFVVTTINPDLLCMIEYVMVEQLGKNLRNNVAHGLADINAFSKTNCLIILYMFCLMTAIRWDFSND